MENRTYLVTEAEKLTGEKAHVLRYWEDELGMEIHRNSLGHRCYTAQDIQIFLGIRELKKKGLHLKAIRELMPKLVQATAEIKAFPAEAAETAKEKPDPAIPGKRVCSASYDGDRVGRISGISGREMGWQKALGRGAGGPLWK